MYVCIYIYIYISLSLYIYIYIYVKSLHWGRFADGGLRNARDLSPDAIHGPIMYYCIVIS